MTTLVGWRTFITVCEEGTLSAAAESLGYTQSAVSRQVAGLEHDLGTALLERLPRGVRPTPAGQALLPHARLVVGELARARRSVQRAMDGEGVAVSLGAVPSATADLVPRALRALHDAHPDQRCHLTSDLSAALVERVSAGDLDLGVVTDYPPGLPQTRDLTRIRLLHDEMCVVVPTSHRLAGRSRRVRLSVLADDVWAEDNAGSETLLLQAAGRAGFEPRVELVAGDLLGKVGLVAAGLAVALVPGLLVASLPETVAVVRVIDAPSRRVYTVRRADRERPEVRAVEEALRQAATT